MIPSSNRTAPSRTELTRSAALQRSAIKPRFTALACTPAAPGQPAAGTLADGAQQHADEVAPDDACTLRFSVCRNDTSTTVRCHSNGLAHGKGMGLKVHDDAHCYGCAACHAYLDGGRAADRAMTYEKVQEQFEHACIESRTKLQRKGLISA